MNKSKAKVAKAKTKKILNVLITYCILIIVAFVFFFPCLWLILASFSKSGSIYSFDGFFPKEYGLDAFKALFTDTVMYNYPKWFLNTLFIAVMSCVLGTLLTILTAYCMSRFRFKSRKAIADPDGYPAVLLLSLYQNLCSRFVMPDCIV